MAYRFTITIRETEFTFDGGKIFSDGIQVPYVTFLEFAAGVIDSVGTETPRTVVDFVVDVSGASGLDTDGSDFDILREAVTAAGLVDVLADESADFSVFAPTDAAFIELARSLGVTVEDGNEAVALTGIIDALNTLGGSEEAGAQLLKDVLLYHVAPGGRTLAELEAGGTVATALGASFVVNGVELIDNEPDVANPTVVAQDIRVGNGVIQGIDRVLLPLDIPGNDAPNIVAIAAGNPDFSILVRALDTAGLVEAVQNSENVTVFAPTNAAFTQLAVDLGFDGDGTDEDAVFGFLVEALTALGGGDPIPVLTDILLYHVSPGAKSAADVDAAGQIATLLDGATFGTDGTELIDNEPDIDNPNIVIRDIQADNGTVQAIDRVLIPLDLPGNEMPMTLLGTGGADTLRGGNGDDYLLGRFGADALFGNGGNDILIGGFGGDLLEGGGGNDKLFGGFGNDVLNGGEGHDSLVGGFGNDVLDGGLGHDRLHGGFGQDSLDGGKGNDHLYGNGGNDMLNGGLGADLLFGGRGRDMLNGGTRNDILIGGNGKDMLIGGEGDDRLWGGSNGDMFDFSDLSGNDVVGDLRTNDTVILSADDFADLAAVEAAAESVGRNTLLTTDAGSIKLLGVNEHDLHDYNFEFV